jgi:hypothetical protein
MFVSSAVVGGETTCAAENETELAIVSILHDQVTKLLKRDRTTYSYQPSCSQTSENSEK